MNSRNKKLDDLTIIKGIGPARQEWLREKLGIRTYQNLVDLAPREIVTRLKSDGQIVSSSDVELWITHAKALIASEAPVNPGDWVPFGTFVIEFQSRRDEHSTEEYCTAIQHMESDIEQKWPGLEIDQMCQWMQERMGKKIVKVAPHIQPLITGQPPSIKVTQIQMFQPADVGSASAFFVTGQSFQGSVHGNQPLEMRVHLSISGCDLDQYNKAGVQFIARIYARSIPTGDDIHIGDSMPTALVIGKNDYISILPAITLPAGMYRIKVVIRFLMTPPPIAYQEAQLLQVI